MHERTGIEAARLTEREQDVLGLLAEAYDAKTMAVVLGITVQTCRGYLKSLLMKLGAHSQLEALVIAARAGLVDLSPADGGAPLRARGAAAAPGGRPTAS